MVPIDSSLSFSKQKNRETNVFICSVGLNVPVQERMEIARCVVLTVGFAMPVQTWEWFAKACMYCSRSVLE